MARPQNAWNAGGPSGSDWLAQYAVSTVFQLSPEAQVRRASGGIQLNTCRVQDFCILMQLIHTWIHYDGLMFLILFYIQRGEGRKI